MIEVANNKRGTAYSILGGFGIPTAAKTGTAETGTADPTRLVRRLQYRRKTRQARYRRGRDRRAPGRRLHLGGPIFRRIMEIYFYGKPQKVYRWESSFGVINPDFGQPVPTPTPEP